MGWQPILVAPCASLPESSRLPSHLYIDDTIRCHAFLRQQIAAWPRIVGIRQARRTWLADATAISIVQLHPPFTSVYIATRVILLQRHIIHNGCVDHLGSVPPVLLSATRTEELEVRAKKTKNIDLIHDGLRFAHISPSPASNRFVRPHQPSRCQENQERLSKKAIK